jgi:hypothetical protein
MLDKPKITLCNPNLFYKLILWLYKKPPLFLFGFNINILKIFKNLFNSKPKFLKVFCERSCPKIFPSFPLLLHEKIQQERIEEIWRKRVKMERATS